MEAKDKITILLKEYDTLRQEILNRINNRFMMLGMVITFLAFVLVSDSPVLRGSILGLGTKAIILISGVLAVRGTRRQRLR